MVLLEAWCLAAPLLILQDTRGLCFLPTPTCIPGRGMQGQGQQQGPSGSPSHSPCLWRNMARGGEELLRGTEAWLFCHRLDHKGG